MMHEMGWEGEGDLNRIGVEVNAGDIVGGGCSFTDRSPVQSVLCVSLKYVKCLTSNKEKLANNIQK